jgi:hypothetical protein
MVGRKCEMDIIGGKISFRFGEDIEGLEHRKAYRYAMIWLPHDGKAKTFAAQGKSVQEQLAAHFGWGCVGIVPSLSLQDGIQAARALLKKAYMDEEGCADGIAALESYRREYDPEKRMFRDAPLHDWSSHLADAFRMMAIAWREPPKPRQAEEAKFFEEMSLDELWKDGAEDRQHEDLMELHELIANGSTRCARLGSAPSPRASLSRPARTNHTPARPNSGAAASQTHNSAPRQNREVPHDRCKQRRFPAHHQRERQPEGR